MTQNNFKHGFSAQEILIKSSQKGDSDDVEAPSSSFYKIRWSLKPDLRDNVLANLRELKFTPLEFETYRIAGLGLLGVRLKFTPMEFETNASDFCIWRKAEA